MDLLLVSDKKVKKRSIYITIMTVMFINLTSKVFFSKLHNTNLVWNK